MRLSTAIRTMPAIWLGLPLCLLAAWYAFLQPTYPLDPYSVDATAAGTATLPFVAPFCAAVAAWEASRLRRANVWGSPSVRSRLVIAGWPLLPVALVGTIAVLAAVVVELVRFEAGAPDLRFVGIAALVVVTHTLYGFAIGLALPFVAAGPVALVVSFIWLAFIPAVDPVWLRHVTGLYRDCCGLASDLDSRAVFASAVVHGGIVAAVVISMFSALSVPWRFGTALVLFLASLFVGISVVEGMGHSPRVARDPADLRCSSQGDLTICLWPEHEGRQHEIASIAARAHQGWQAAGIDAPSTFTEADPSVAPAGALAFGFNGVTSTEDDIVEAMANGMLPEFPECPAGATGAIAFEYLRAWYAANAGMSAVELRERYSFPTDPLPSVLTVVNQLETASLEARQDWILGAEAVSQACDEWQSVLLEVEQ